MKYKCTSDRKSEGKGEGMVKVERKSEGKMRARLSTKRMAKARARLIVEDKSEGKSENVLPSPFQWLLFFSSL